MKYLKDWKIFEYSKFDIDKDYLRIQDMADKSKNMDHMIRLATTMANRITKGQKAYMRGLAADELGYPEIAEIFFDRAKELEYEIPKSDS